MNLVFLLEEPSAKDLLEGLLPRMLPESVVVTCLVFDGKQDLEKNIVRRIKGWLSPDTKFVILRDQDAGDCVAVKAKLAALAREAGRPDTLVRVACRELESWILGDWEGVAQAYGRPKLAENRMKATYRDPDRLSGPVSELRKYLPEYQKRDGARRMGQILSTGRNSSKSFQSFCRGLASITSEQK